MAHILQERGIHPSQDDWSAHLVLAPAACEMGESDEVAAGLGIVELSRRFHDWSFLEVKAIKNERLNKMRLRMSCWNSATIRGAGILCRPFM